MIPEQASAASIQWPWRLSAPPIACSESRGWKRELMRRWSGTSPVMEQPPLDHHYIVMHLGGVKKVERRGDGPMLTAVAEEGTLTMVPAGTAFTWRTTGPIAFAHLYVRPDRLDTIAADETHGDPRGCPLVERVAVRDRLLEPLFRSMLAELESSAMSSTIHLDCLLDAFLVRLTQEHTGRARRCVGRTVALAPHRLRRVLDLIEERLGEDLSLADLVSAAGSSQYHFSHAFRIAMGVSPYRYLISRRIEFGVGSPGTELEFAL